MENPQGRGGDSITHLITNGSDLYADLAPLAELEREDISSELDDTIQPYLQPIPKTNNEDRVDESQSALTQFDSNKDEGNHSLDGGGTRDTTKGRWDVVNPTQTHDQHTGLRLQDIWRYFRYSWLTPYNTVVGRNINFLVRDAARPNDPGMGIASLGSPMMNFGTRDDHIGWTEHGLRSRRTRKHRVNLIERQLPKEERTPEKKTETVPQIEWLETKEEYQARRQQISKKTRQAVRDVIEDAINDVRFDDFVDQYDTVLAEFEDLEYDHFKYPTADDYENTQAALRRLEGLARYVIASNTDEGTERKDTDLTSFHSTSEESGEDTSTDSNSDNSSTAVDGDDNKELTTSERIVNKFGIEDIDLDDISIKDENPEKMSSWRDRSETALFVRKRAEALQRLLHARYYLLKFDREQQDASAEDFISAALDRKSNPDLNRALRTALREIKKRRSGACMMNIMVCGAIPPYNDILGGKLVAMALTGPETIASYKEIYGDQVSEIASGMKGEEVQKPTELVFLDTTGLFEKGSAQYDRIRIPADNGEIRYEEIGTTDGVGTVQFGATTRKWLSTVTRVDEGRRVVRGRFGEGVSPRLRKIRQGLTKCGLSGDLLKHNSRRVIYSVDLAENAKPFLRAESEEPQYYWNFDDINSEQQSIYNFWKDRWVSKRVQKEWILDSIRDFDRNEFLLSNHFEDQYNETFSRYQE